MKTYYFVAETSSCDLEFNGFVSAESPQQVESVLFGDEHLRESLEDFDAVVTHLRVWEIPVGTVEMWHDHPPPAFEKKWDAP